MNENVLLQTLGFDLAVDHPHTHIIKCCQLVRGGRNIRKFTQFHYLSDFTSEISRREMNPAFLNLYSYFIFILTKANNFLCLIHTASKDLGQVSYLLATNM